MVSIILQQMQIEFEPILKSKALLFSIFYFSLFYPISSKGQSYNHAHMKQVGNSEKQYSLLPFSLEPNEKYKGSIESLGNYINQKFGLNNEYSFQLINKKQDNIGYTHYNFKQYYRHYEVIGAIYSIHIKGDIITYINGIGYRDLAINGDKFIEYDAAKIKVNEEMAKKDFTRLLYFDESSSRTLKPSSPKIFCADDVAAFVWEIDVQEEKNGDEYKIYIDAKNGSNKYFEKTSDHCVSTTVNTTWSGTATIHTTFAGNEYQLRDECPTHAGKLRTSLFVSGSTAGTVFTDADNVWDAANQKAAVTTQYNGRRTLDYFQSVFSRNSWDNNNGKVNYRIQSGFNGAAFYPSTTGSLDEATLSIGTVEALEASDLNDYSTLDIIGHEFTHAIELNEGMTNSSIQGKALKESFSDIFGNAVQAHYTGTLDWLLGEERGQPVRDMQNPNNPNVRDPGPDTFRGLLWSEVDEHVSAGVNNFWFYLLTNGGTGVNDNNYAYAVNGIGHAKALQIVYRVLSFYNGPIDYAAAKELSFRAARDLFPEVNCYFSNEVLQVINAWDAVGVRTGTIFEIPANITITYENLTFYFNSDLKVNGSVTYKNCQLYFAPNCGIIIGNYPASIALRTCKLNLNLCAPSNAKWNGILSEKEGLVSLVLNSELSDAKIGVKANGYLGLNIAKLSNNLEGVIYSGTSLYVEKTDIINSNIGLSLFSPSANFRCNNNKFLSNNVGLKISLPSVASAPWNINNCTFNNQIDIMATGQNVGGINFEFNTFMGSNYNMLLDGDNFYKVLNNDFTGSYAGAIHYNNGSNENFLNNNIFSGTMIGQQSILENGELSFLDNCYTTFIGDVYLDGTIAGEIGASTKDAGNCFTKNDVADMTATTSNTFTYYRPANLATTNCKVPVTPGSYTFQNGDNGMDDNCGSGVPLTTIVKSTCYDLSYLDCSKIIAYLALNAAEIATLTQGTYINPSVKARLLFQLNKCRNRLLLMQYKYNCYDATIPEPHPAIPTEMRTSPEFRQRIWGLAIMLDDSLYSEAITYLDQLAPVAEEDTDFIAVQRIYIRYLQQGHLFSLSSSEQALIYAAGLKPYPLAAYARGLYHLLTGTIIYPSVPRHQAPAPRQRIEDSLDLVVAYPNPATETLTIVVRAVDAVKKIEIYNLYGQSMYIFSPDRTDTTIDINTYQHGMYYIKSTLTDESTRLNKFVKQ